MAPTVTSSTAISVLNAEDASQSAPSSANGATAVTENWPSWFQISERTSLGVRSTSKDALVSTASLPCDMRANSQPASANIGIAAKNRSKAMALAACRVSRVIRPSATSHSLWLQGLAPNNLRRANRHAVPAPALRGASSVLFSQPSLMTCDGKLLA